jgi:hypothetical protein
MAARTNRTALASTVRALRRAERLEPADAALVRLAEVLAGQLDGMIAAGEKAYALAAVARVYFAVEEALRVVPPPPAPDAFAELLRELATPEAGEASGWQ